MSIRTLVNTDAREVLGGPARTGRPSRSTGGCRATRRRRWWTRLG